MIARLAALMLAAVAPGDPPDDPFARGYLGVTIAVTAPPSGEVAVNSVQPGTPAARSGLRPGDVLVRVGQVEPKGTQEVIDHIKSFRPGTAVKVLVRRPGTPPESLTFTVRLMARPKSADYGLPFPPE